MSILNTRRIAAISLAVSSLLTLSVAHADLDQRDRGEAHSVSEPMPQSERAANAWVQTKYSWLRHTTACESESPNLARPALKAASISAWKAAKYPALAVTDRAATTTSVLASGSGPSSEHAWLRSKYPYRYATPQAQPAAELICAR